MSKKILAALLICVSASTGCAHGRSPYPFRPGGMGAELWGWINGQPAGMCLHYPDDSSCCGYPVRSVCDGTGAQAAGIKPGDVVYEIDGKPIINLDANKVSYLIRGEENTTVDVRVCGQDKTFHVQRRAYVPCW